MGDQERLMRSEDSGESSTGSEFCMRLWARFLSSLTVEDSALFRSPLLSLLTTPGDETDDEDEDEDDDEGGLDPFLGDWTLASDFLGD